MNIKIVKNKYINALLLLMLFSAMFHMAIIFYMVSQSGNWHLLNYFNILEVAAFLPADFTEDIISFIAALVIYLAILKFNK